MYYRTEIVKVEKDIQTLSPDIVEIDLNIVVKVTPVITYEDYEPAYDEYDESEEAQRAFIEECGGEAGYEAYIEGMEERSMDREYHRGN